MKLYKQLINAYHQFKQHNNIIVDDGYNSTAWYIDLLGLCNRMSLPVAFDLLANPLCITTSAHSVADIIKLVYIKPMQLHNQRPQNASVFLQPPI